MGKKFCENLENVPTNGKKGITAQKRFVHAPPPSLKIFWANSKAFGGG
jgi:hypothetical protein